MTVIHVRAALRARLSLFVHGCVLGESQSHDSGGVRCVLCSLWVNSAGPNGYAS